MFKAINDITYLIYTNNFSIISFDIDDNIIQFEIKNAHNNGIASLRYYKDNINKKDLFISLSGEYNIKLWNFNTVELIVDLGNVYIYNPYFGFRMKSVCFLNENNQAYIIASDKVLNFKGELVKDLNIIKGGIIDSIDVYYDKKYNKAYIIYINECFIVSIDYNENKLYKRYSERSVNFCGGFFIIKEKDEITEIIE